MKERKKKDITRHLVHLGKSFHQSHPGQGKGMQRRHRLNIQDLSIFEPIAASLEFEPPKYQTFY